MILPSLQVYIGYDPNEKWAYEVAKYSIQKYATKPVTIFPIPQSTLRRKKLYTRAPDVNGSTAFSMTRWITPYLAHQRGRDWAVFMDCDQLFTDDIFKLERYIDADHAVFCCKHNYIPIQTTKMWGNVNETYPKKNWSSFVVWNVTHPSNTMLRTSTYLLNNAPPKFLHRFMWLEESEIGELPLTFNWLAGEKDYQNPNFLPINIHYTNGGKFAVGHESYPDDFQDLWEQEYSNYLNATGQADELGIMSQS